MSNDYVNRTTWKWLSGKGGLKERMIIHAQQPFLNLRYWNSISVAPRIGLKSIYFSNSALDLQQIKLKRKTFLGNLTVAFLTGLFRSTWLAFTNQKSIACNSPMPFLLFSLKSDPRRSSKDIEDRTRRPETCAALSTIVIGFRKPRMWFF